MMATWSGTAFSNRERASFGGNGADAAANISARENDRPAAETDSAPGLTLRLVRLRDATGQVATGALIGLLRMMSTPLIAAAVVVCRVFALI